MMNAIAVPEPLVPIRHDEIDLFELLQALWQQRKIILASVLLAGVIGAVYAYTATTYYSVQSVLRPANLKDLDALNGLGIYPLEPEDALQRVGSALDSYDNRLSYFRANPVLLDSVKPEGLSFEQAFARFNDGSFRMLRPDAKAENVTPFVGIELTYPQTLAGVDMVNGFVDYSIDAVRKQIDHDLTTLISNRLALLEQKISAARVSYEVGKNVEIAKLAETDNLKRAQLQDELAALRQQLKTRRENRIKQLDEAIGIASTLGIERPTTPSALGDKQRDAQGSIVRTEVSTQEIPLYFMGSEALKAERGVLAKRSSDDFVEPRIAQIANELKLLEHNRQIELLKSRKDEDLFLVDLAKWREEAAQLKEMKIDAAALELVKVDQVAVQPASPVKPKKGLIVFWALLLGGLPGVFIVMGRVLMAKQQAPGVATRR